MLARLPIVLLYLTTIWVLHSTSGQFPSSYYNGVGRGILNNGGGGGHYGGQYYGHQHRGRGQHLSAGGHYGGGGGQQRYYGGGHQQGYYGPGLTHTYQGVIAPYRNDKRQLAVNARAYKIGSGVGTAFIYGVPGTGIDFGYGGYGGGGGGYNGGLHY